VTTRKVRIEVEIDPAFESALRAMVEKWKEVLVEPDRWTWSEKQWDWMQAHCTDCNALPGKACRTPTGHLLSRGYGVHYNRRMKRERERYA
jgi:hypothetical protein